MKMRRAFLGPVLLLAFLLVPAARSGAAPAALDPFEDFLKAQRDEIAKDCRFDDGKDDVVHEAAWARFKGAVERRLRKDGTDDLRTRWDALAAMPPSGIAREPEFPGLLRTYAAVRYATPMLDALRELIRCRTVQDTTVTYADNPAFRRIGAIVDSLAREHEFAFETLPGGAAVAVSFGAGPDTLGIWSHLDVVPADTAGWSVDPFAAVVKDGTLEARGAEDDKGAFAAALFGLRALRDTGVPVDRHVLLFGGFGEETTFDGINGFLKERPVPSVNVVIDGTFPVTVGEKGQTTITVASSYRRAPMRICRTGYIIRGLSGGVASNQVPDRAEVVLISAEKEPAKAYYQVKRKVEEFNQNNSRAQLSISRDNDEMTVTAVGRAAHGSAPDEGHNAIVDLVEFLADFGTTCPNPPHWVSMFVNEFIREETSGRGLGIAAHDSIMGSTTVNVGRIGLSGDSAWVRLDIRFPRGRTPDSIIETIRDRIRDYDVRFTAGLGVSRADKGFMPIYVDTGTDLVKKLRTSFEEVYREDGTPVSIAGTTYAKKLPNAVSFGPALPGATRAHAGGEFMRLTELDDLLRVYTTAFYRLTALP